ncbi:MAG: DUF1963 domain-containing protein [Anaerolineae bacterium]|nr:DUF1963 domain-containing protein [Anaerolineae bacterium]
MDVGCAQIFQELESKLASAAIAQIGGFRPPQDPRSSWFGKGVGLPGEGLPEFNGEPMFPLLQINVSELPFVPPELSATRLLVLFHNRHEHPFDRPHGDGWEIREYADIEELQPLPKVPYAIPLRPFPIRWRLVDDDAPGWETAWDIIDLTRVNQDEKTTDYFFKQFNRYAGTKVGGFPYEIQHSVETGSFVFQVGSEEKANWMWADNGIGYFGRCAGAKWTWSCQSY